MWKTIITISQVCDEDEDAKNERIDKNKKVLEKVMNVLEEDDVIEEIMNEYNKEMESIDEYRWNRKKRILRVLKLADVEPDDYVKALKESSRKGVNVILFTTSPLNPSLKKSTPEDDPSSDNPPKSSSSTSIDCRYFIKL